MQTPQKFAIASAVVLVLVVGGMVERIHYKNTHDVAPLTGPVYGEAKVSEDDMVFARKLRPDSLADERDLIGKTIWVSAAGQMDYYPATAHHADYAHPAGVLLGAEALIVHDVFEQVPPPGRAVARITAGSRHVLLAFTMPNSSDPKKLYAVPVGHFIDGRYEFYTDDIFFYDDPHILYKHWGAATWAHVDKHEVVPGMSENQCMMALGQVIVPSSDAIGNRTVTYDNSGHPIKIVFENDKAVSITPQG
jgi:hypothetical protein